MVPDTINAAAMDSAEITPHSVYIIVSKVELRFAKTCTLASVSMVSVLRKAASWERSRSISIFPGSVAKKASDLGHETNQLLDEVQEQNRVKDQLTGIAKVLQNPMNLDELSRCFLSELAAGETTV
ncbi:hypothetical protein [Paenibacillus sp. JJ-100]|uniref:hypothetical protein n=1 Tax=Paenibacillus sp. JJ-100 TaxID=2974896 RepID=UPI00232DCD37|nr:hypothetical protein [Paenibacillus sp. JJ-100]